MVAASYDAILRRWNDPINHEMLTQCWLYTGPPCSTLAQHSANSESACLCWASSPDEQWLDKKLSNRLSQRGMIKSDR